MSWLVTILAILAVSFAGAVLTGHCIHEAEREVERGIDSRYPTASNDNGPNYFRAVRS